MQSTRKYSIAPNSKRRLAYDRKWWLSSFTRNILRGINNITQGKQAKTIATGSVSGHSLLRRSCSFTMAHWSPSVICKWISKNQLWSKIQSQGYQKDGINCVLLTYTLLEFLCCVGACWVMIIWSSRNVAQRAKITLIPRPACPSQPAGALTRGNCGSKDTDLIGWISTYSPLVSSPKICTGWSLAS